MPGSTALPPIKVIRRLYQAIAADDLESVIDLLWPDIVVSQSSALPFAGVWRGHDGFRAMGAAIYAAWPDFAVTPRTFLSSNETVIVLTHVVGAVGGATPLDQLMIELWRVRDGKAIECRPFYFDPVLAAASAQSGE